jgi:intracellular sulfur oxidation DsrE/DsrF family protein
MKTLSAWSRRALLAAGLASLLALGGCVSVQACKTAGGAAAEGPVKAVYHLTNGLDEAQRGIGNIRNHLAADPSAKIVVVGNGLGIDFMLDGAKDRNGNPFDATIQELKSKGVEFRLCNNTLVSRKIEKSKVIADVSIVPSGVAEAARLQAREGFVYLRP